MKNSSMWSVTGARLYVKLVQQANDALKMLDDQHENGILI